MILKQSDIGKLVLISPDYIWYRLDDFDLDYVYVSNESGNEITISYEQIEDMAEV